MGIAVRVETRFMQHGPMTFAFLPRASLALVLALAVSPVPLSAQDDSKRFLEPETSFRPCLAHSQAMIANAYQFMQVSGAASAQYKSGSGWVQVSADQMKAIALAVGTHVQACFAAEQDLDAKITAGTVTTMAQIDAAFAAITT